jgi:hypothetical protein
MKLLMLSTGLLGLMTVLGCSDQTSPTAPASPGGTPTLSSQAPADGNGSKEIITLNLDVPEPFTCPNGAELSLHVAGWLQLRVYSRDNSRKVELDNFHVTHTWSNSAGETFVDREILAEHYYFDKDTGDLILAFTGKLSFLGIIGKLVTDVDTGEVLFVTGPGFPDHLAQACAALA